MKKLAYKTSQASTFGVKSLAAGSLAGSIYLVLGIAVYFPYLSTFGPLDSVLIFSSVIGALGCFVIAMRWVSVFAAAVLAGAVYGFSPYALAFAGYHPLGSLALAVMPWLLTPAVYWKWKHRSSATGEKRRQPKNVMVVSGLLYLVPFVVVATAFWMLAQSWAGPFFPIPKNINPEHASLMSIVTPFATDGEFAYGFYHLPILGVVMGLFMFLSIHRMGAVIAAIAGVALSFCGSVFRVSPVVWGLVPMLFISVITAPGIEGLALAGKADRNWILPCVVVMAALAGLSWYQGFMIPAYMYAAGTVISGCIYYMANVNIRMHKLRWIILSTAITIDIILGARVVINNIL
jgi:hypothetical protein